MRIAFYSPRASHLDLELSRGGDPVFLHSLFAALRARGHDIEIVSSLDVGDVWRRRIPARRLVREAIAIRKRIKRFSPDAWLVYHTSRTYPDLFGWWQRPRRYVLLFAHTWQSKRLPRRWKLLFSGAHTLSLRRADQVVASRPSSADRLRRRGIGRDRLVTVPFAVTVPEEMPTQNQARRRLELPEHCSVILSATRLPGLDVMGQKTEMFLELLRVFAAMRSTSVLVLVGDGPGRIHVQREVLSLGLDGRVRLVGATENEQMKWFYAGCDVYAYPNPLDRPWMSVLEAQACGRPVVTMRTDSAELTVDEGRTGLLADDLDEFREQLATLAADRARAKSMGTAARQFIADHHSIDARASQIEEWLRDTSLRPGDAVR
jgi:glycosyltransferase involved in cell wall biosynthesis